MSTKIKIDWNQVGEWISKGAKGTEIANRLGINDKTLYRRCLEDLKITFAEFSAQKKAVRNITILEKQMELALSGTGNLQMLIWLGKQYCGQREPEPKTPEFTKAAVLQYINDQKQGGNNEEERTKLDETSGLLQKV